MLQETLTRPQVMSSDGPPPEPVPARIPPSGTARKEQGRRCTCGHGKQAHQHYRRGKDCALCGCVRYRRRLLIRFTGR